MCAWVIVLLPEVSAAIVRLPEVSSGWIKGESKSVLSCGAQHFRFKFEQDSQASVGRTARRGWDSNGCLRLGPQAPLENR